MRAGAGAAEASGAMRGRNPRATTPRARTPGTRRDVVTTASPEEPWRAG